MNDVLERVKKTVGMEIIRNFEITTSVGLLAVGGLGFVIEKGYFFENFVCMIAGLSGVYGYIVNNRVAKVHEISTENLKITELLWKLIHMHQRKSAVSLNKKTNDLLSESDNNIINQVLLNTATLLIRMFI